MEWTYFLDEKQRIFWLYLAASAAIGAGYLLAYPEHRKEALSSKIWWGASARLDYLFFLVSALVKAFLIVPLVIGATEVAGWTLELCRSLGGHFVPAAWSRESVVLAYTLAIFVAGDFTRYWLHRWLHTVPFLWRFHRVHHTAETLNPLTFYRVHPVENLLFGFRYALSAGAVTGLFLYFFGAKVGLADVLGANLFVFLFNMAGANLRHSHLPVRFGPLEGWVVSPYMHQHHHAAEGTRTNFGGALAVWDRLFGTLHREATKPLTFGLPDTKHTSVPALLLEPFKGMKS